MSGAVCHRSIMVKRSCPFNDDMNPQVKIHVRDKEVAKGVMSDHHMKLVYDKTKSLLFSGARKAPSKPAEESDTNLTSAKLKDNSLPNSGSLKQMQLTCRGQLSAVNDVQVISHLNKAPCSRCSVWNPSDMCCCSFCDVSLCAVCTQVCIKCQDLVCSACSFELYDASEGIICRNCC